MQCKNTRNSTQFDEIVEKWDHWRDNSGQRGHGGAGCLHGGAVGTHVATMHNLCQHTASKTCANILACFLPVHPGAPYPTPSPPGGGGLSLCL